MTHLTGRPRAFFPAAPSLDAASRLASILQTETIFGTQPYGVRSPIVCFTESTRQGLDHLVRDLGYEPWGLMFTKDYAWGQGAAPALYVRSDDFSALDTTPQEFRARAIRLEPGDSEWLHEREWRCPCEEFTFERKDVVALLVGSRQWAPAVPDMVFNGHTFEWDVEALPAPWAIDFPMWVWDQSEGCFYESG